jgi:Arc/MetJ-type ribon-helix-helix transcriptional regulator
MIVVDQVEEILAPLGGPEQVLKYLARYTHRVAISNGRLISMQDGRVTFRWRDSAHGNQTKLMTLDAVEFVRRFLLHVVFRPQSLFALRQSRMFCHTQGMVQKIAVTLDQRTVADLDRWVREGRYPNRSRALQSAVNLLSEREKRTRLARELAKIAPKEEMQLAEQGLGDQAWPEY